jgi:hypothetical protein
MVLFAVLKAAIVVEDTYLLYKKQRLKDIELVSQPTQVKEDVSI